MAINPKLINFNRVPTAAVGPAYQAGLTDINEFSRDQDMVDALLKRGSSTEPVQSTREGAYRALQGVLGGYMKGRDKRELQSQKDNFRKTMAQALIAGRGTPGTEETIPQSVVTPTDTRLGVTDPDMLQTELPPPPQQSILDDPSVPDVASLGLERIETPTGPGGQVIQKEYISRTPGTPGGIQPMLDVLRGAGTRGADRAAIELEFGGMQQQAALEAQAVERKAARDDYLFQQKNKAFTPQALVPGRDVPYPDDVEAQRIDIAAAGAGRFVIDPNNPTVMTNTVTGETVSAAMSPAEKEIDKQFGQQYAEVFLSGGFADIEKNIGQLEGIQTRLLDIVNNGSDENLTGSVIGNTPDFVRNVTNPASIDTREAVEEVIQRNLRIILGAQFTEKEGTRLIARAYNEKLGEKENSQRLARVITAMKSAYAAQRAAAAYFEENKTLKGYQGTLATLRSIEESIDGPSLDTPVQLIGSDDDADAQYDNLDPGQLYIDTNGDQKRKPK